MKGNCEAPWAKLRLRSETFNTTDQLKNSTQNTGWDFDSLISQLETPLDWTWHSNCVMTGHCSTISPDWVMGTTPTQDLQSSQVSSQGRCVWCIGICVGVSTSMDCMRPGLTSGIFHYHVHCIFWRQGLSLNPELTNAWTGQPVSSEEPPISIVSTPHTVSGLDTRGYTRLFLDGCWDLNSNPRACSAGTLQTKPSLQQVILKQSIPYICFSTLLHCGAATGPFPTIKIMSQVNHLAIKYLLSTPLL